MMVFLLGIVLSDVVLHTPELTKESSLLAVDDRSGILIGDVDTNRLLLFDFEGKQRKVVGGKGQGPGQFLWITTVFFDGDYYWVHDFKKGELCQLDKQLVLLKTYSITTPINRSVHVQDPYLFVALDNNGEKGSQPYILKVNFRDGCKSEKLFVQDPLEKSRGLHAEIGDSVYFLNFDWDSKLLFASNKHFIAYCMGKDRSLTLSGVKTRKVAANFKKSRLESDYIKKDFEASYPPEKANQFLKALSYADHWPNFVKILCDQKELWLVGPWQRDHFQMICVDARGATLGFSTINELPLVISNRVAYSLGENAEELLTLKSKRLTLASKP